MKTSFLVRHRHPNERGAALITAVFAAFLTASMIALILQAAQSSSRDSAVKVERVRDEYVAQGAIETAKRELREAVANWRTIPEAGDLEVDGIPVNWTITEVAPTEIIADASGIQTLITGYEIEARVRTEKVSSVARRLVNIEATPIFQFMVFYNDDLEVFPGPNMTLGGRVHTNGDLFIGCGGTLTVDTNYLRVVGKLFRRRKDNPSASDGTVVVRRWVQNPFDASEPRQFAKLLSKSQLAAEGVTSPSGYDSAFTAGYDAQNNGSFYDSGDWLPWGPGALEMFSQPDMYTGPSGNTVLTASHGVTEAATPRIGSISAFEESDMGNFVFNSATNEYVEVGPGLGTHSRGYFHSEAGLKILLKSDGTLDAVDASGNDVSLAIAGAVTLGNMYDGRLSEGVAANTKIIRIDIGALHAAGQFPANGLIYASSEIPAEGVAGAGLLLKNGRELPRSLTVVTQQSLYVQGDYNTVNKKGAAVIGDAVNLLSNSWTGNKSAGQLPSASDTTYNMAMITGNHETGVGRYNGGLENLPRFHENWSGKSCTIRGSLVNTWQSAYATGPWKYGGDRYQAPARNWSYETAFNDVANLPPFTPMAVTARDVVSW